MRVPLAWLNLVHEKSRLLAAIAGVGFAVLLVFMNLGFLGALAKSATVFYNEFNADIYLVSPLSLEISTTRAFPRERLYQAEGIPGVERAMPLYMGYRQWRNPETLVNRAVYIFAFNLNDPAFLLPELQDPEVLFELRRPESVLMDRLSRPEFGPQTPGTETVMSYDRVSIVGNYSLGGGFAADGTLITSDLNFRRFFDPIPLSLVNLGLIKLEPGADLKQVQTALQEVLPKDVLVYSKAELVNRDRTYWITSTSTGFIFGMGVVVSCIVGVVVVYQILYTDISNHMKQYATLKAMGYRSGYLCNVIIQEAIILAVLSYIPGLIISVGLYAFVTQATSGSLPVAMEVDRAIYVLLLTVGICIISGLVSIRKVITAEPVELF
ncbi:MAG: ABC transporter permease DevC [Oculatellaceae cyanobacterium Prado106]|jgi:putative ABC transport system permease protein|nr:ABC transporter permease DevC [Oculatellaceae cyanobacterium Prado106]